MGPDCTGGRLILLLPSVMQATGWCRGRLTDEETWMVYDAPPHWVTQHLRHHSASLVAYKFWQLLPGRCLEQGVRHFMTSFGIVCEGGRMRFPRLDRAVMDEDVGRLIVEFGQGDMKMGLGARQLKRKQAIGEDTWTECRLGSPAERQGFVPRPASFVPTLRLMVEEDHHVQAEVRREGTLQVGEHVGEAKTIGDSSTAALKEPTLGANPMEADRRIRRLIPWRRRLGRADREFEGGG
jgi:hypothetical protein